MRQYRASRRALVERQTCAWQGQCPVHVLRKSDLLRGSIHPVSLSPPPLPATIDRYIGRSARHSLPLPSDRCEGGATPSPNSVAPTPISLARPITARSGSREGKVSTVGQTPARIGCPPSLAPDPISAVLTTFKGRAYFLMKTSGRVFRLVASGHPVPPGHAL